MIRFSRNPRRLFFLLILAAGILAMMACGQKKSADDKTGDGTGSEFVRRVAKVLRNDEASWPAEIPDDVPAFAEGRITAVRKAVTADGASWTIHLAGVEEGSFERYFGELKDAGWDTTFTPLETSGSATARKESFVLTLNWEGTEGSLVVQLSST
jgi:hypothetical protein